MFELPPLDCSGLVEAETMSRIVVVESAGNPFAIGVVGGRLERQPVNLQEAVQTAEHLEKAGFNYSIGLSQVNRVHFKRFGWAGDIKKGFDACQNLHAGADVYVRCKQGAARSLKADSPDAVLRAALSCYYSGSYVAGEKLGYVDRVLSNERKRPAPPSASSFRSMFD
jgi:type IV secretion system protein VirB1